MMTKKVFDNIGIPRLGEDSTVAVSHKIGGDNMCLLEENRKVIEILSEQGIAQTFCVSAFRSSRVDFNTTSKLIEAGKSQSIEIVLALLSEIEDFHTHLLENILLDSPEELRKKLITSTKQLFQEYKDTTLGISLDTCSEKNDYMVGVGEKVFSLLSIGEIIAAKVFVEFLKYYGIPAVYIDTTELKNIAPQNLGKTSELFFLERFKGIFSESPYAVPVIPGYIGGIDGGILAKLGRGYTDYTSARSAIALCKTERFTQVFLYIQKLYGFKSTDPRVLGENSEKARSVKHLSYNLAERAISHKGANAGLINGFTLDEGIKNNNIAILVGNPTDTSDIAVIDKVGDTASEGVDLVLGRDYNEYDNRIYGRRNIDGSESHIIYLMGDNLKNLGEIFSQAKQVFKKVGVEEVGAELILFPKPEISFVFKDKQIAIKAQRALHRFFIEKK